MSKIRLNTDEIKCIMLFESMTGAKVKDCVEDDNLLGFVVQAGDMGLAIGKGGSNIERVKKLFGKSVWVMEHSEEAGQFVKNMFRPAGIRNVRLDRSPDHYAATIEVLRADRNKVLGPEGRKIKLARKLVKRHFGIDELDVRSV